MFSVMLVLFMNNVMFLCRIILSFKEHVSCEVKILKRSHLNTIHIFRCLTLHKLYGFFYLDLWNVSRLCSSLHIL